MMPRKIKGLKWARALDSRPAQIPQARPRGLKAKGLAYEAQVGQIVPGATRGQWFEFWDSNGPGFCQVDYILPGPGAGFVLLECKLTWTPEAFEQLEGLYIPVVCAATGFPAIGLQVCRNLVPGLTSTVVADLERGVQYALLGRQVAWHWLGAPSPRSRPGRRAHQAGLALAESLL